MPEIFDNVLVNFFKRLSKNKIYWSVNIESNNPRKASILLKTKNEEIIDTIIFEEGKFKRIDPVYKHSPEQTDQAAILKIKINFIVDKFINDVNECPNYDCLFQQPKEKIREYYKPPIERTVLSDMNRQVKAASKCILHINKKKLSKLRQDTFLKDINEIDSFKELLRKNFSVENPSDEKVSELMEHISLNLEKEADVKKYVIAFLTKNFSVENPSDEKVLELMQSILLKDIQVFKELLKTNLVLENLNLKQQNLFWDKLIDHLDQGGLPHVTEHYLKEKNLNFLTSFPDDGKEEFINLFIDREGHLCIKTINLFKQLSDYKGKKIFAKEGEYFFKTETECIIKPFVTLQGNIYFIATFPKVQLFIDPKINEKFPELVPDIKNKYNIVNLKGEEWSSEKKPPINQNGIATNISAAESIAYPTSSVSSALASPDFK